MSGIIVDKKIFIINSPDEHRFVQRHILLYIVGQESRPDEHSRCQESSPDELGLVRSQVLMNLVLSGVKS